MPHEAPLLEVRDLEASFSVGSALRPRRLRAVRGVSLSLRRGEVVALVGESGSGKSTVAGLILRLVPAANGSILLDGRDVLAEEPRRASLAYRSRVQMVFQDPFASLNPVHTVGYHLARPLRRHGKVAGRAAVAARVRALLEAVGLTPGDDYAGRRAGELSGGQRQRVAIARALAVEPDVIIADEPTSMLDVSIRMGVLNLIERLARERGVAFLYITHDLASARYVADRTLVMYGGRLVEGGPSEALMQAPAHPYSRLLLSSIPDPDRAGAPAAPRAAPAAPVPEQGCPFAPRCPEVAEACGRIMPPSVNLEGRRWARCHLLTITEEI